MIPVGLWLGHEDSNLFSMIKDTTISITWRSRFRVADTLQKAYCGPFPQRTMEMAKSCYRLREGERWLRNSSCIFLRVVAI